MFPRDVARWEVPAVCLLLLVESPPKLLDGRSRRESVDVEHSLGQLQLASKERRVVRVHMV